MVANALNDALTAQGRGSRTKLAQAMRVSNATVSKWAQGQTTPEIERWGELEQYFDWPAGHLARLSGLPITSSTVEIGGLQLRGPADFVVRDGDHVTLVFVSNDEASLDALNQAAARGDLPSLRRDPQADRKMDQLHELIDRGSFVRLRLDGSTAEILAVIDEDDDEDELPAAAEKGKAAGARKARPRRPRPRAEQ